MRGGGGDRARQRHVFPARPCRSSLALGVFFFPLHRRRRSSGEGRRDRAEQLHRTKRYRYRLALRPAGDRTDRDLQDYIGGALSSCTSSRARRLQQYAYCSRWARGGGSQYSLYCQSVQCSVLPLTTLTGRVKGKWCHLLLPVMATSTHVMTHERIRDDYLGEK
jgi:hypothetical protein